MRLYEEYINRHKIAVPIIRHADHNVLFFRKEKPNGIEWKIFTAQFRRDVYRHGVYHCALNQPTRNSVGSGFKTITQSEIEWDCFEDYMLNIDNKNSIVFDSKEVLVAAWEIFVFQAERYLIRFSSNDDFFCSLDITLPIAARHEILNSFLTSTSFKTCEVYNYWGREMMKHVNDYSHALAKVLSSNNVA
jgi:hypothetical protein